MPTCLRPAWLLSSLATLSLLGLGSGCIVGFEVNTSATNGTADKASDSDSASSSTGSSSSTSGDSSSGSTSSGASSTSGATSTSSGSTTTGSTTVSETTGETSTTTGGAVDECKVDGDCKLYSDCCSCQAAPAGEIPDPCDLSCQETRCEVLGIDSAVCRFGVCATSRVNCDTSTISCKAEPPVCPAGLLPQVNQSGDCWTGECVRGIQCESVPSCDDCPESGWTCVSYQAFITKYVCEPVPAACEGTPTCDCTGDLYCTDEFSVCNDLGDAVACACPNC